MNSILFLTFKHVSFCNSLVFRRYCSSLPIRFHVNIIPALKDNYMYVLVDKARKSAVAIDPVEPQKILENLSKENATLKAVLTTHHHFDHAGGNSMLLNDVSVPVYGGDDRIEAITNKLAHNERIKIDNFSIRCLHTPCHTSGHVCYYIESRDPICFTGDTLFVGGCGRFFEGSADQMHRSLSILRSLPLTTKIYCGHEYTLNNLKFALHVEPSNKAIAERIKIVEEGLEKNIPSVPSTIADELSFNPFMRADCDTLKNFTKQTDPVKVIQLLRDLKDDFKS